MKSFKHHIKEEVWGQKNTWDYVFSSLFELGKLFYIPLSPKMIERAIGKRKITALHVTGTHNIMKLIKLQGSSKSVSTFTSFSSTPQQSLLSLTSSGVEGGGGVVAELEGTALSMVDTDSFTVVDKQGRRWIARGTSPSRRAKSNPLKDKLLAKVLPTAISIYKNALPDLKAQYPAFVDFVSMKDEASMDSLRDFLHSHVSNRGKQKIIKVYYNEVNKIVKDQHDLLLNDIFHSAATRTNFNEVTLAKFKIKNLYVMQNLLKHPDDTTDGEPLGAFLNRNKIKYQTFAPNSLKKIKDALHRSHKSVLKLLK